MTDNFFAYGSLMLPEVMRSVTDRSFASEPATLHEFARYCLRKRTYPGLVPESGASVDGVLYRHLPPGTFARLDGFEGEEYVRTEVNVESSCGRDIDAQTYVLAPLQRALVIDEPWNLNEVRAQLLRRFVRESDATMWDPEDDRFTGRI